MNDQTRSGQSGADEASDEASALPPRLFCDAGRQGEVVRRYLRRPHGGVEERAWRRLQDPSAQDRFGRPRSGRRRAAYWATTLGAAAALGMVGWLVLGPSPSPSSLSSRSPQRIAVPIVATIPAAIPAPIAPTTTEPPVDPSTPTAPVDAGPAVALGRRAQALVPGRWKLLGDQKDEASIELRPGSAARAHRTAAGSVAVSLASGQIALSVVHKPRPAPFRVSAPPYVFTVLGTVFQVERRPTSVELVVTQGRVAVSRAGRELATITTGGRWSGGVAPTALQKKETSRKAPSSELAMRDAGYSRAEAAVSHPCGAEPGSAQRLSCLRVQASGTGLAAETALYEIGKMTRDELHDPAAALATFESLRTRFPDGALRMETALSIVELLARTGRYYQALDDSAALLARAGNAERAAELHLLRGNIYREALADLTRAAHEYQLAAAPASRGPTADEASFLHAVSLEALGQRDQAAAAYRHYLERPRPAHEKEARSRLERLRLSGP